MRECSGLGWKKHNCGDFKELCEEEVTLHEAGECVKCLAENKSSQSDNPGKISPPAGHWMYEMCCNWLQDDITMDILCFRAQK